MARRIGRWARWTGIALLGLILLLLVTFALPVQSWRTGEIDVPPLPVVPGGPAVSLVPRLWIDTDAGCGYSRTTDPDDCFALLLLTRSPTLEIAGVSTVFGNAPLAVTDSTTRMLAALLADAGDSIAVYRGAAHPGDTGTAARTALRRALAEGPLTVVALGPLTTIAAALDGRPDLRANVSRLVAVMGRRRGHLFHPAEGRGHGILFGHGPVFRDFNFDQDPDAAAQVLELAPPVTLVPYEAAREVMLTAGDLAALERAGGTPAWVAARAAGWLDFWQDEVGRRGFYPFDLVAAAYVRDRDRFGCARVDAWVAEDDQFFWPFGRLGLLVGMPGERPEAPRAAAPVVYCEQVAPGTGDRLVDALRREAGSG